VKELTDLEPETFFSKLKKRNKDAFHLLYEEYKIPLYNVVFSMIRDNDRTADIIQDTFIRAIRKIHQLQDIKSIKYWLFRIAINLTINMLNKEKKTSLPGDELEVLSDKAAMEDFQVQPPEDPEELRLLIFELAAHLPLKQRLVFNLKYVENLKEAEIAEITNIPVGTVKSRLNIARARIKNWLSHRK